MRRLAIRGLEIDYGRFDGHSRPGTNGSSINFIRGKHAIEISD